MLILTVTCWRIWLFRQKNCAHNKSQQVSTLLFNEAYDSAQILLCSTYLIKNVGGRTSEGHLARFWGRAAKGLITWFLSVFKRGLGRASKWQKRGRWTKTSEKTLMDFFSFDRNHFIATVSSLSQRVSCYVKWEMYRAKPARQLNRNIWSRVSNFVY